MSEWQPIETAPKDGSLFDVWIIFPKSRKNAPYRVADARFINDGEHWLVDKNGKVLDWKDPTRRCFATHWMPLPEPPKA